MLRADRRPTNTIKLPGVVEQASAGSAKYNDFLSLTVVDHRVRLMPAGRRYRGRLRPTYAVKFPGAWATPVDNDNLPSFVVYGASVIPRTRPLHELRRSGQQTHKQPHPSAP